MKLGSYPKYLGPDTRTRSLINRRKNDDAITNVSPLHTASHQNNGVPHLLRSVFYAGRERTWSGYMFGGELPRSDGSPLARRVPDLRTGMCDGSTIAASGPNV